MKRIDLNFEKIYQLFKGRIFNNLDCGQYVCGNSACCYPAETVSFICFLPGEFDFLQKKFGKKLPFVRLTNGRYHCRGKRFCLGNFRPIDCRSFPLWPFVSKRKFVSFIDCRGKRCPLKAIPPKFLDDVKNGWELIFRTHGVLEWAEGTYANGPLIIFPENRHKRYINEAGGRVSLSG